MTTEREIWFLILSSITLGGLIWGLRSTRRVIEAPFLFSTGMAIVVCPQLYIAARSPTRVTDDAFRLFCLMAVLCTFMFLLGYSRGGLTPAAGTYRCRRFNYERIFNLGLAFAILGGIGTVQLLRMGSIEEWRGWPVYWVTLEKFILPGVTLMFLSYLSAGGWHKLAASFLFLLPSLSAVFTWGRRSATLILPFVILVPVLLRYKKLAPPRWSILAALGLAFIVVYGVPHWRGRFRKGEHIKAVAEKPFAEILEEMFSRDSDKVLEVPDSMLTLGAAYRTGQYDYGFVGVYNSLIALYFPGSLLGQQLKESLLLGTSYGNRLELTTDTYGIPVAYYTAKSGFADLFVQFSFFGAAILCFVGWFYRRVHDRAMCLDDPRAALFISFFAWWPAMIPYDAVFYSWITMLPNVAVLIVASRACIYPAAGENNARSSFVPEQPASTPRHAGRRRSPKRGEDPSFASRRSRARAS